MNFKFIDLFSGAGGWSSGLQMSGLKCVGLYDIDKSSCNTANANFDSKAFCVDLTKNVPQKLPENATIIAGSPPCQGFSNEGKKNVEDPRNNLVWIFFDIVEKLNPDVWLFENVPGFKRLYNGRFFDILMERLEEMGYNYKTFLLDSKYYGIPQTRIRFFAMGAKNFVPSEPKTTHGQNLVNRRKFVTLWEAISDLPKVNIGEKVGEFNYDKPPESEFQEWARSGNTKIFNHTTQNHSKRVLEKIRSIPNGKGMEKIVGKYKENKVHYCGGYRRAEKNKPSYTVYWTRGMTSIHPEQDRFLSPRECARLQTFPDKFVFRGNTIQNYTQVGNAVPPLLAKRFGDLIINNA